MIRERVSTHGVCRALEPPEELGAITMPSSEIGTIKEGPAMRYLSGQALWDKKFARKRRQVAKQRERNLKQSKDKDAKKIGEMWHHRVQERKRTKRAAAAAQREEARHHRRTERSLRAGKHATPGSSGYATPLTGDDDEEVAEASETSDTDSVSSWDSDAVGRDMTDESWSWGWALDGEAPPPSAIVSRRDFVSS